MPDAPSRFDAPPDAFGYGRYSICIHAPSEIAATVQTFRERIGMADFTTEPHISVVPGPGNLKDLDALKGLVERVAAANATPTARFKTPAFSSNEDSGFLMVELTPDLVAVRDALIGALEADFGVEPGNKPYRPHMTLYQMATPEESAEANRLGPELDCGAGFTPPTLDLVGRLGRPRAGSRDILAQFPFSAP